MRGQLQQLSATVERSRARRLELAFVCALLAIAGLGAPPGSALAQSDPAIEAVEPVETVASATPADAELQGEIQRSLRALGEFEEVQVSVEAGIARLTGQVLSPTLRDEAESVAAATEGVGAVVNELELIRDPREVLGPVLADLMQRLRDFLAWLPLLGVALILLVMAALLAGWLGRRDRIYERLSGNRFVQDLWRQVVRTVVFLLGALIALELLDATALVGAVLGAAGVAGLAIGFAFRDVTENFIASALLSFRQPFLPNDHVVIDGHEGKVLRLTPRATVLMTLDGNHLRIPNATVFKSVVLNYTRNPKRRFSVKIGIGTEEDLLLAQQIGIETLAKIDGVLAEPGPNAWIDELGDSSVVVRFVAWVDQQTHEFTAVRSEGMRRVKSALEEAGLDLPEPIYRLRVSRDGAARARAEIARSAEKPGDSIAAAERSTRVDGTIEAQIEQERSETGDDLLSPTAPLE